MWNSKVTELFGVDHVERVKTENVVTGQSTWLDAQGVFIYIDECRHKILFDLMSI